MRTPSRKTPARRVSNKVEPFHVGKKTAMGTSGAVVGAIVAGPVGAFLGGVLGTAFGVAAENTAPAKTDPHANIASKKPSVAPAQKKSQRVRSSAAKAKTPSSRARKKSA